MARGLLIIDIQRDYFPDGAYPLVGAVDAARAAHDVLAGFRDRGEPIVHMQHVWDAPDAPFLGKGTVGGEIHPDVAPAGDELVLTKAEPNSFLGTGLQERLQALEIDDLIVIGMMSSMCVDATARAALDLGYPVSVVPAACAAPDLEFEGRTIPGADVHAAFMAALGDAGATLLRPGQL